MPTALRATESRSERSLSATVTRSDLDRWYDADAVTFRGGEEASLDLARRVDMLRAASAVRVDQEGEAERAGLPPR